MEEEAKEIREAELNEKWKKFMLENEIFHLMSVKLTGSGWRKSFVTFWLFWGFWAC